MTQNKHNDIHINEQFQDYKYVWTLQKRIVKHTNGRFQDYEYYLQERIVKYINGL